MPTVSRSAQYEQPGTAVAAQPVPWPIQVSGVRAWLHGHRHVNWILADQGLVSACNFLTGIALARFLGPQPFGVFVLLYSALLYVNTVQGALVLAPMISTAPQFGQPQRRLRLRSALTLQLGLSLALAGAVALIGFTYLRSKNLSAHEQYLLPLALAIVAFQMQDWLRRYYFVEEKGRAVFLNDLVSYGGQVLMLVALFNAGALDVGNALWVVAGSSALACGIGLSIERLAPLWHDAAKTLRDGWRLGRDYLFGWQLQWAGAQGLLLVGGSYLGAQAVGALRATSNIVGPVNVVYQVMENIIPVRAARHFAAGGRAQLIRYLLRVTLIGTAILCPLFLALALYSTTLIRLAYGEDYVAYASLVGWQVSYALLTFYMKQIAYFHRSTNQTRPIAWSGLWIALPAIALSLISVGTYAETGIMMAAIFGQIIGLVYLIATAYAARSR